MPDAKGEVLVVEDDFDIREVFLQVLSEEGYRVAGACNGREALELLRSNGRPHVILLDLMMPVMSGWQFRDEQQRDPELSDIPVVVVSAHEVAREAAQALGVRECLRKPVDLDQLVGIVDQYCRAA
ncbi:MAG: response regulator [Myxococcales bacterium]